MRRLSDGRRAALVCGVALLAFALAASPVAAASKEIERLLIQVANLQQQVGDLQRVAGENAREIKRLGDVVGEQNGAMKKILQDQKLQDEAIQATLKDLSDRLAEARERAEPTASATTAPANGEAGTASAFPKAAVPAGPDIFSQAYAECLRGNYDLGIQGFNEFLRMYPNTERSDNALYWIGECQLRKGSLAEANETWDNLLRDYPASDRLPDTRVKKGMTLEALGRKKEAIIQYRYVVEHYPNSDAAKTAKLKLNPQ
jgi:tol-pal system protein YbgF